MSAVFELTFPSERDYYLSALPNEDDQRIKEALWPAAASLQSIRQRLDDGDSWVLLFFARRMASLAVRHGSAEPIADGLLGLLLEGGRADFSESLAAVSLLYDAATRVRANPQKLFLDISRLDESSDLAIALKEFLQRPPNERTIDSWGYRTSTDDDGFVYRRRW